MVRGVKLFAILAVSVLFMTGCGGEKTLTCTNSEESSGIKMNQEVTMTFKDDKVTYVKMSIDNEATDDNVSLEIDLTKASDDALSEYGLDGIADEKATYEDTKKEAEADGFTCK